MVIQGSLLTSLLFLSSAAALKSDPHPFSNGTLPYSPQISERHPYPYGSEQAKNQSDILSLTISDIHKRSIDEAIQKFFDLKDDQLLSQVITRAYYTDNRVPNILLFIKKLPWLIHRATAYRALVEKMIAHRNESISMGLNILSDLEDLLEKEQEPRVQAESHSILEETKNKLMGIKSAVLGVWEEQIRGRNFHEVLDFEKNYGDTFNRYAEDLVKRAYEANDSVIITILAFSNQLLTIEASSIVYVELYSQMNATEKTHNQPIIKMAHKIQELMHMDNYKHVSVNLTNKVKLIWDEFPYGIRAIVSGFSVCVANDGFRNDAYLYVQNHYDNERDNVHATEITNTSKISLKWMFEADERDDKLLFRIKSDPNNEYIYAASDSLAYSEDKRRVFSWRGGDAVAPGTWEVEDFDWRRGKFYLRNTFHNEYLNAYTDLQMLIVPVVNGRRYVYTNRRGGRGPNPVWKIKESC